MYSKLSEYGVQRSSDGSVSVSDSVLVKVSGADEDNDKEVLVSWSLQVRNYNEILLLDFSCFNSSDVITNSNFIKDFLGRSKVLCLTCITSSTHLQSVFWLFIVTALLIMNSTPGSPFGAAYGVAVPTMWNKPP